MCWCADVVWSSWFLTLPACDWCVWCIYDKTLLICVCADRICTWVRFFATIIDPILMYIQRARAVRVHVEYYFRWRRRRHTHTWTMRTVFVTCVWIMLLFVTTYSIHIRNARRWSRNGRHHCRECEHACVFGCLSAMDRGARRSIAKTPAAGRPSPLHNTVVGLHHVSIMYTYGHIPSHACIYFVSRALDIPTVIIIFGCDSWYTQNPHIHSPHICCT